MQNERIFNKRINLLVLESLIGIKANRTGKFHLKGITVSEHIRCTQYKKRNFYSEKTELKIIFKLAIGEDNYIEYLKGENRFKIEEVEELISEYNNDFEKLLDLTENESQTIKIGPKSKNPFAKVIDKKLKELVRANKGGKYNYNIKLTEDKILYKFMFFILNENNYAEEIIYYILYNEKSDLFKFRKS